MSGKKAVIIIMLAGALAGLFPRTVQAATINAASCSQEDVQAAIDKARDGDVVVVPAGTATWTTPNGKEWTPSIKINKGIVLKGAGMDKTIIKDGTIARSGQEMLLMVRGAEGKPFRITGITFDEVNDHAITICGSCKNWRIDHCKVNGIIPGRTRRAILTEGFTYGVIDHCIFKKNIQIMVFGDENAAFERPLTLGTSNAVYIEDCTFDCADRSLQDCTDGRSGGRLVFRYNNAINAQLHVHGIAGGGLRGIHSYEFYENTFMADGTVNCYVWASLRGGTGVLFNNTCIGKWGDINAVHLCVWWDCKGHKRCTSYPCTDQIGRSTDSDDGIQDLEPLYEWNNKKTGADIDIFVGHAGHPEMNNYIQEGRDFYNDTPRPGYTPYTYPHPLTFDDPAGKALRLSLSDGATLQWSAVNHASEYRIWRDWRPIATTAKTMYSDPAAPRGSEHVYLVQAYDKTNDRIVAAEGMIAKVRAASAKAVARAKASLDLSAARALAARTDYKLKEQVGGS